MGAGPLQLWRQRRRRHREDAVRLVLREEPLDAIRHRDCLRNREDRAAAAGRAMSPIVNAMSVDVEDYFQVSAFERVVARGDWNGCESRVVGNTQKLLEIFDRHGVRATFFVLGWV